ncbi:MAG TPA: FRG domain-containing protein, partial [Lacunisphaera sp.]|nr:FRG domain-containing protein [Lacunisphaera sp.]
MHFANEDTADAEPLPDIEKLCHRKVVEHPDEFISELTGITAPWMHAFGSTRPWFRGMARASFSLEPSLLRYRPRQLMATESNLELQFAQYAVRLLDRFPASRLDRMTVMQHHGFPTRLLDWTENAFAALYFSVKEYEHLRTREDAVVWVVEPVRLHELQRGDRQIPFSDDDLLGSPTLPLPFYPAHMSARLTPQRATFTLHP